MEYGFKTLQRPFGPEPATNFEILNAMDVAWRVGFFDLETTECGGFRRKPKAYGLKRLRAVF
jgi:hypothetical protein